MGQRSSFETPRTFAPFATASQTLGLLGCARLLRTRSGDLSPPDYHADDVRRGAVFFLDLGPCRGAVFRREQAALLGQDHPAITPPVRQHAVIVDKVVALLGGEDARLRLVERVQEDVVGISEQ